MAKDPEAIATGFYSIYKGEVIILRQTIDIIRGTSKTVNIAVSNADGTPYQLRSSEKLRFCVKRGYEDDVCVIEKELTSIHYNDGVYMLHLSPSDTESLDAGRYFYDCGLQIGGEYYMIVERSQFNIIPNISSRDVS